MVTPSRRAVLSVPLMINAQTPTMITANMAFRINAYGDYGYAEALVQCLGNRFAKGVGDGTPAVGEPVTTQMV